MSVKKIIMMFIIVQTILYVNLATIAALIVQVVVFLLVYLAINLRIIIELKFRFKANVNVFLDIMMMDRIYFVLHVL